MTKKATQNEAGALIKHGVDLIFFTCRMFQVDISSPVKFTDGTYEIEVRMAKLVQPAGGVLIPKE